MCWPKMQNSNFVYILDQIPLNIEPDRLKYLTILWSLSCGFDLKLSQDTFIYRDCKSVWWFPQWGQKEDVLEIISFYGGHVTVADPSVTF